MSESSHKQTTGGGSTANTYSSSGAVSDNTTLARPGRPRYWTMPEVFGNPQGSGTTTEWLEHQTDMGKMGLVISELNYPYKRIGVRIGVSPGGQWTLMSYEDWEKPKGSMWSV